VNLGVVDDSSHVGNLGGDHGLGSSVDAALFSDDGASVGLHELGLASLDEWLCCELPDLVQNVDLVDNLFVHVK